VALKIVLKLNVSNITLQYRHVEINNRQR